MMQSSMRWQSKGRAAGRKEYDGTLRALQVELVKYQKHLIECADKVLVISDGALDRSAGR